VWYILNFVSFALFYRDSGTALHTRDPLFAYNRFFLACIQTLPNDVVFCRQTYHSHLASPCQVGTRKLAYASILLLLLHQFKSQWFTVNHTQTQVEAKRMVQALSPSNSALLTMAWCTERRLKLSGNIESCWRKTEGTFIQYFTVVDGYWMWSPCKLLEVICR